WGVTPPISVAESTEREREITVTLMEELRRQNTFETEEESRRREIVLGRVAALVKKFVKEVSLAKGLSETASNAAGGKIFTFGSYRLGVHGPGSDIDTVCVVPKHVSRDDFFNVFEPMVRGLEGATEVSGVPGAFAPVIGAKIDGVSMGLLCAPLGMSSIPEDLSLKDNSVLKNLDESVIRSTRLTDELLRLVPNVQVFRDALRCIKLWAQRKAIYSNVNGYLGGVAWAMLVARVCQLYPNAAAGAIVEHFLAAMSKWHPVLLKQIEDGSLQVRGAATWEGEVDTLFTTTFAPDVYKHIYKHPVYNHKIINCL
ncbi:Poly(A) polymerase, partial [Mycena olivaceomarginata]